MTGAHLLAGLHPGGQHLAGHGRQQAAGGALDLAPGKTVELDELDATARPVYPPAIAGLADVDQLAVPVELDVGLVAVLRMEPGHAGPVAHLPVEGPVPPTAVGDRQLLLAVGEAKVLGRHHGVAPADRIPASTGAARRLAAWATRATATSAVPSSSAFGWRLAFGWWRSMKSVVVSPSR